MNSAFKEYCNAIPDLIEMFLKALSHKIRLSIYMNIISKGELSFTFLIRELKIEKSAFYHHIKKLEIAGVVQNYYRDTPDSREYSYYKITQYGRLVINNLILTHYHESNTNKHSYERLMADSDDFISKIKAISNKKRMAIGLYLKENMMENESDSLSFSALLKFCGVEKSVLTSYVKNLTRNGIVENYFQKSNSADYSFYKLTEIGDDLLNSIIGSYNEYFNEAKLKKNNSKNEENINVWQMALDHSR